MSTQDDSPLSIAANVVGILTLAFAVLAAAYVRVNYLRNSDAEYFRVKASLSWYKTESAWLTELLASSSSGTADLRLQPEYQMYAFVMDDIIKLEQRILELLAETELRADSSRREKEKGRWAIVPQGWGFTTEVAMAWLPVRTRALELVRQRDALTARVQFTQMSMVSSRVRSLETSLRWLETRMEERLARLEANVEEHMGQIGRVEEMVHRLTHRNRMSQAMDQSLSEAIQKRRLSTASQNQSPSPLSPSPSTRKRGMERRTSVASRRRSGSR